MPKNTNIIEINGKRYDAVSGELLTPHGPSKPHHVKVEVKTTNPAAPKKTVALHKPRHHGKSISSHHPHSSKTLMRHAVQKPAASHKRAIKAHGHTYGLAAQPAVAVKPSVKHLDEHRLKRAAHVPKSHLISHFSAADLKASFMPLEPAAPEPHHQPTQHHSAPTTKSDLLEHALKHATGHTQKPPKATKRRLKRRVGLGSAIGLTVALLALVVVQNMSGVQLQMASAKAGFDVGLPSNRPSGFSLSQVDYSAGVAALNFHSNSDSRHYTITQKRLIEDQNYLKNYVKAADASYLTERAADQTVYLYGQRNATWLKGDIWYTVASDGSLSDRQLLDIAASL